MFNRAEIANLRRFADVRYASAGTVVAAAGAHVTTVQIVVDGELELMTRSESGRATMAVVRSGGVIADIPLLLGAPCRSTPSPVARPSASSCRSNGGPSS